MELPIKRNIRLDRMNSFGVAARTDYFAEILSEADLLQLFQEAESRKIPGQKLVLGGGSNMLFTKDFSGITIKISIPGIHHEIKGTDVSVTAGGGVVWNDLVSYCVRHDFGGIENLALIPGTVGAAPVQNIGAYGVELMDVFESCRAFDTQKKEIVTLLTADCGFSYRDSIFKNKAKDQYIITHVTLRLSTRHRLQTSYGAIEDELARRQITRPSIQDVANVVSAIRTSKLPDPSTIGNAGSFFKNPVISNDKFLQIKKSFPNIVHYPWQDEQQKIAAGWLIEQCGWKGKQVGNCGTWKNQALVLVNYGNAQGKEIYQLSEQIIEDVKNKFGIILEREVNVI